MYSQGWLPDVPGRETRKSIQQVNNNMLATVYVGIDVSADSLSVAQADSRREPIALGDFPNTGTGRRRLLNRLRKLGPVVHCCLEPTSCLHLDLTNLLDQTAGFIVSVINPRAVKDYGRSLMKRAKTDPGDAVILALYGEANRPAAWVAPRQIDLNLRALSRRIEDVTKRRTSLKNQRYSAHKAHACAPVIADIEHELAAVVARLKELKRTASKLIKGDELLAHRYRLLVSVKGISQTTGIRILAELSVLPDGLTKKQWIAICGLDPTPRESGKYAGKRRISKQGNTHLRCALMMPALVALRHCPQVKAYYENLLSRSRCARMQGVCAVMRKLLQALWGMLQTDTTWNPERFYAGNLTSN